MSVSVRWSASLSEHAIGRRNLEASSSDQRDVSIYSPRVFLKQLLKDEQFAIYVDIVDPCSYCSFGNWFRC
jgi:hypothetical protein